MDFSTIVSALATNDIVEIPSAWLQGRTLFGGVSAAALLARTRAECGIERPLASMMISYLAPSELGMKAEARVLRKGRSLTYASAELQGTKSPIVTARMSFAEPRESTVRVEPVKREVPPMEGGFPMMFIPGLTPNFTQNFESYWVRGSIPFTGGDQEEIRGFCRHKTAVGDTLCAWLGLVDAWPCPALGLLKAPAPASTVDWSLYVEGDPADHDPSDWFYYNSRLEWAKDGCAHMSGELLSMEGEVLVRFTQLVALFG